jgi:hypothetical protein
MGKLTTGLSLRLATDSRLMKRERWTPHSSFCSSRMAPMSDVGPTADQSDDDVCHPTKPGWVELTVATPPKPHVAPAQRLA